jgi:hypothetical protein
MVRSAAAHPAAQLSARELTTEECEQTVNNDFAYGKRYLGDDWGCGTEQRRWGEPQPAFGPRA